MMCGLFSKQLMVIMSVYFASTFLTAFHLVIIFNISIRQECAKNSHFKVHPFKKTTGTTVLRNHLANEHIENWVDTCDKFKISIMAQVAQKAINAYRQRRGQPQTDDSQAPPLQVRQYSREAFVDAIVEWIVADDQVSPFHISSMFDY